MKFSSKIEKCSLSPMRKFAALAEGAEERGLHIYRLNIGQPDLLPAEHRPAGPAHAGGLF